MVRLKQRYLLLNILYPPTKPTNSPPPSFQTPTPNHINAGLFTSHLRNHITLLFGDFGLGVSLSSLKVVYLSTATSTLILRVPRSHHRLVWAALSHVTELPGPRRGGEGVQCVVRVVRVSGTIRKAEEELIRRARRDVVRVRMSLGDDDDVDVNAEGSSDRVLIVEGVIEDLTDVDAGMDDDSD